MERCLIEHTTPRRWRKWIGIWHASITCDMVLWLSHVCEEDDRTKVGEKWSHHVNQPSEAQ